MKKLYSKTISTLLLLGVVASCGIKGSDGTSLTSEEPPISESTSETPIQNNIKMSLASKAAASKGDIVLQNNDINISANQAFKLMSDTNSEGTPLSELVDSIDTESAISHNIIEGNDNFFDLALAGLKPGQFSVSIVDRLNNEDVTSEFKWLYNDRPNRFGGQWSLNSLTDGSIAWEKFNFSKGEYRLFRLVSETFSLKNSQVELTITQGTVDEPVLSEQKLDIKLNANELVSQSMLISSLDFDMTYSDLGGYTDLENMNFSISSEAFDIKYTNGGDLFYDEGTVLSISLPENSTSPSVPITILYKDTLAEKWEIVNNYMIIFPHITNSQGLANPRLSLGINSGGEWVSRLRLSDIYDTSNYTYHLRVNQDLNWTGLYDKKHSAKLIQIDGVNNFEHPLSTDYATNVESYFTEYKFSDTLNTRIRDLISEDITFKLVIDEVIFDLGKLKEYQFTVYSPGTQQDIGRTYFEGNSNQIMFR
jgi:hypothetical protein